MVELTPEEVEDAAAKGPLPFISEEDMTYHAEQFVLQCKYRYARHLLDPKRKPPSRLEWNRHVKGLRESARFHAWVKDNNGMYIEKLGRYQVFGLTRTSDGKLIQDTL